MKYDRRTPENKLDCRIRCRLPKSKPKFKVNAWFWFGLLVLLLLATGVNSQEVVTTSVTIIPQVIILEEGECYQDCCTFIEGDWKTLRCEG